MSSSLSLALFYLYLQPKRPTDRWPYCCHYRQECCVPYPPQRPINAAYRRDRCPHVSPTTNTKVEPPKLGGGRTENGEFHIDDHSSAAVGRTAATLRSAIFHTSLLNGPLSMEKKSFFSSIFFSSLTRGSVEWQRISVASIFVDGETRRRRRRRFRDFTALMRTEIRFDLF